MRKLMGVLTVAVITMTACGGGSSNNASSTNTTVADTAATVVGGNFTDFCSARAAFAARATGAAPDVNLLKNAAQNLDRAVQYSPSEIKPDVKIVVDANRPFLELMASVNYDFMKLASDPAKQQQLQALAAKLDEAKVKDASARIEAWGKAHCS